MIQQQPHRWHVALLPTSALGRWSVILGAASIGFFWLHQVLVGMGQGGDGWFSNPLLSGSLMATGLAAVAGLIAVAVAIIRDREFSLAQILPIAWGIIVVGFTLGEFVNPH